MTHIYAKNGDLAELIRVHELTHELFNICTYAHEHGCIRSARTCSHAASGGHLVCLRYAHENGCPWDVLTCACAAFNGHLECIQYAAQHGHLDCLIYAHKHGCKWDKIRVLTDAARHGHCFLLDADGCPYVCG